MAGEVMKGIEKVVDKNGEIPMGDNTLINCSMTPRQDVVFGK
jgi:hypothetical protein